MSRFPVVTLLSLLLICAFTLGCPGGSGDDLDPDGGEGGTGKEGQGCNPDGSCDPGLVCSFGECTKASACVPDCDDRECGDNGCGGSCGQCTGCLECHEGACLSELDSPGALVLSNVFLFKVEQCFESLDSLLEGDWVSWSSLYLLQPRDASCDEIELWDCVARAKDCFGVAQCMSVQVVSECPQDMGPECPDEGECPPFYNAACDGSLLARCVEPASDLKDLPEDYRGVMLVSDCSSGLYGYKQCIVAGNGYKQCGFGVCDDGLDTCENGLYRSCDGWGVQGSEADCAALGLECGFDDEQNPKCVRPEGMNSCSADNAYVDVTCNGDRADIKISCETQTLVLGSMHCKLLDGSLSCKAGRQTYSSYWSSPSLVGCLQDETACVGEDPPPSCDGQTMLYCWGALQLRLDCSSIWGEPAECLEGVGCITPEPSFKLSSGPN